MLRLMRRVVQEKQRETRLDFERRMAARMFCPSGK